MYQANPPIASTSVMQTTAAALGTKPVITITMACTSSAVRTFTFRLDWAGENRRVARLEARANKQLSRTQGEGENGSEGWRLAIEVEGEGRRTRADRDLANVGQRALGVMARPVGREASDHQKYSEQQKRK